MEANVLMKPGEFTSLLLREVERPTTPPHPKARCKWCGSTFAFLFKQPENKTRIRPPGHWFCSNPPCALRQIECGFAWPDTKGIMDKCPWIYVPTPAGVEFHMSRLKNLLFGGQAGGSKSHALRWNTYWWMDRVPGYVALLLRETFGELENTHLAKMAIEAQWLEGFDYKPSAKRMITAGGSSYIAGHCQNPKDMKIYLGTEWDGIDVDEASLFIQKVLVNITGRARSESTKPEIRARGGGWVRLATNPGGPASIYLDECYMRKRPDLRLMKKYHPEHYGFLPAQLEDNPYLEDDYEETRLDPLDHDRYEQLRLGKGWGRAANPFFGKFDRSVHVREIEA